MFSLNKPPLLQPEVQCLINIDLNFMKSSIFNEKYDQIIKNSMRGDDLIFCFFFLTFCGMTMNWDKSEFGPDASSSSSSSAFEAVT